MQTGNFPHQRKPETHAAVFTAAGFVHAEEGLEDAPPEFLRDAAAGIRYADVQHFVLLCHGNAHRPIGAVVLDGVFRQIEKHSVDQRVAPDHNAVALPFERDAFLLRQRREIREDLLDHRRELDLLVPRHLLQIAHLQQRLGHLRQPLRLLPQQREKLRRLRQ